MIQWFEPPYKGTNKNTGFEVVIHGLLIHPVDHSVEVICIDEDGTIAVYPHGHIVMDWRFTRGRGWHGIDEEPE